MKLYTSTSMLLTSAAFALLHSASALPADSPIEIVIDDVVASEPRADNLPAVSVGVIRDGILVTRHYGTMSASNKSKPTNDTLYEIGSVTKAFTGLLLADAVVRGELRLDAKLNDLLPADSQMDGEGIRAITLTCSTFAMQHGMIWVGVAESPVTGEGYNRLGFFFGAAGQALLETAFRNAFSRR